MLQDFAEQRSSIPMVISGGLSVLVCLMVFLGLKFRCFGNKAKFTMNSSSRNNVVSVPGTYRTTEYSTYGPPMFRTDNNVPTNRGLLENQNLSASMTHLHQPSKTNLSSSMIDLQQPSKSNFVFPISPVHPPTNESFSKQKMNRPSLTNPANDERFPTFSETARNPLAGGHRKGKAPGSPSRHHAPPPPTPPPLPPGESSRYTRNTQKLAPSLIQLDSESES